MSTTDAITVRLSPDERDVILDELWRWTGEESDPPKFATRDEAAASLVLLQRAFDLRDELDGWPQRSGGAAPPPLEAYTATVTRELIDLLRVVAEEAAAALADDRRSFELAKAGNRDWWPCGCPSAEEMRRSYEEIIARGELTVRAAEAVLGRLAVGATA